MSESNGLLPEAVLDKFRQHRGAGDSGRFTLGDDIESVAVEFAGRVTLTRLYREAAKQTGRATGTLRLYHETARACDEKLRAEFGDVLVYEHFREVRYLDDRAERKGYLAWCVDSAADFGGMPAPANKLAAKIKREKKIGPPPPTFAEHLGRARADVDRARDAAETDDQRGAADALLALLGRWA